MECSYCNVEFEDLPVNLNGEIYCSRECAEADTSEGELELHEVGEKEIFGAIDDAPPDDSNSEF